MRKISAYLILASFSFLFLIVAPIKALQSWTQVNVTNFGDDTNFGGWGLTVNDGKLYIGTSNNFGGEVWSYDGNMWTQVNVNAFGDANNYTIWALGTYGGNLYAGIENDTTGVQVWRYSGSGTSWTKVNTDGFGDSDNIEIWDFTVYRGDFYAGTANWGDGCEIWRYEGGSNWMQVNTNGFGSSGNAAAMSFAVKDDKLYTSTDNSEVWVYNGGTSWSQVNVDEFGDSNNEETFALEVYNGNLYAGVSNFSTGVEVWRYSGSGTSWTQVNSDGFGDSDSQWILDMTVYNDMLYVGAVNIDSGAEVWEYDGNSWMQVNTSGFGDINTGWLSSLGVYDGKLYAVAGSNGEGPADIQVWESYPLSDLEIEIESEIKEVSSYDITYTITMTNNGPDPTSGLSLTANLPSGSSFVSANGSGWTCSEAGGTVTCDDGSLAVGNSTQVIIVVHVEEDGEYVLDATVSGANFDSLQANNSAEIAVLAETGTNMIPYMSIGLVLVITCLLATFTKDNTGCFRY